MVRNRTLGRLVRSLDGKAEQWNGIRLSPSFLSAFMGALAFGLLGQGMGLFNKFSWHDDIFSLFMTGTASGLGRWMLHVMAEAERWFYGNGYFSLPVVNGVISLLCVGLSAGLMTDFFRIRSRWLSLLLGGVMAVVTSLFGFMYTVHYYMIALLMVTGGSILFCGVGPWWKKGIGVLLCGCGIGTYQAFIPIMLMIVLTDQILFLARREEDLRAWGKRVLIRAACVAGAMGVYFAGSELFLRIKGAELDSYLGISQMGEGGLSVYLARVLLAYREFFLPSRNTLWDMYPQALLNVYRLMLCLDAALAAVWVARTWKKGPARALLLAAAFALVPLGCNFVFVMSDTVHSLMVYGQVMQMVLLVCLADGAELPSLFCRKALSGAAALLLALSAVMYIRYDNQCYLKTAFQQQEAISWNTTLVTRIESAEGFRDELPVAFVNRRDMADQNLYNLTELDFLTLGTYDTDIRGYLNDWAWSEFLARWCGFRPQTVDPEQVKNWPEVQAMPSYPDDGAIQIIRDVIVVKFSES